MEKMASEKMDDIIGTWVRHLLQSAG
jgi:hypothetical protein